MTPEQTYYAAENKRREAEKAAKEERDLLLAVERARIDAQIAAKHGHAIHEAWVAQSNAKALYDAWRVEEGTKEARFAPGATVIGSTRSTSYWAREASWIDTLRGVVEVVTPETVWPANEASWRRAEVGSLIVRLLKKDGTLGIAYKGIDELGVKWREAQ